MTSGDPAARPGSGRAAEAAERAGALIRTAAPAAAAVLRRGAARLRPRGRGGATTHPRGLALRGQVWTGDTATPFDGIIVLDESGRVVRCAPAGSIDIGPEIPQLGGPDSWIGPGIVDAHVHLAFGDAPAALAGGVVAVRDLGAPGADALRWRTGHAPVRVREPFIAVSGPILTAPGGYPSRTWGRAGFAAFVDSPSGARAAVQHLAADGVDVIKIALEPAGGRPVPDPAVLRAVVGTAHSAGLAVVAHALTAEMVARAVDAGVDELAHTPTERLPDDLVARLAAAAIPVVSTLQTFFSAGVGRAAAANAAALVAAGVELRYGTDLGNTGTLAGVDPRELDRLAEAGLGRLGALRAATLCSSRAKGIRGRSGLIRVGASAQVVVLPGDPLREPEVWRSPTAVVADGRVTRPSAA